MYYMFRATCIIRPVNSPESGGRLPQFDLLFHSPASTLWVAHIQQKMSFLTKKHISLVLLVTGLWNSKVMNIWAKHYWKYRRFPHDSINKSSMYSFVTRLKLFYIDNCLYIAVETFVNDNFISYLNRNFTEVWCKLRKGTILHVLPPILSKRLTALYNSGVYPT